ncbi:hypothetical protein, partial [Caldisericum exile]|uniref:hypothetical protein n=1 Tax=Caldisericum exile TaxID=693075 RepID=UPI003C7359EB
MENLKHEFIEKFKEAIASLKKNGIPIGIYILVSSAVSLVRTILAKSAISPNDLIGVVPSSLIELINFLAKTPLEKMIKSNSGDSEKLKSSIDELSNNIKLIEKLSKRLEDAAQVNIKYDEIINGVVKELIDSEVFKEILKEQGINLDDLN